MHNEKIIVWWDANASPEQWRADILKREPEGTWSYAGESGSPEFPARVDGFGPFEEDLLIRSLKEKFPDADIVVKFQ